MVFERLCGAESRRCALPDHHPDRHIVVVEPLSRLPQGLYVFCRGWRSNAVQPPAARDLALLFRSKLVLGSRMHAARWPHL
jgi:hypothetical protein